MTPMERWTLQILLTMSRTRQLHPKPELRSACRDILSSFGRKFHTIQLKRTKLCNRLKWSEPHRILIWIMDRLQTYRSTLTWKSAWKMSVIDLSGANFLWRAYPNVMLWFRGSSYLDPISLCQSELEIRFRLLASGEKQKTRHKSPCKFLKTETCWAVQCYS